MIVLGVDFFIVVVVAAVVYMWFWCIVVVCVGFGVLLLFHACFFVCGGVLFSVCVCVVGVFIT